MQPFEYVEPRSVEEVVALLSEQPAEAKLIAGGTDLLAEIKEGVEKPRRLVSLASLSGLREISENDGGLALGAMVTIAQVAGHPAIRAGYAALAQAAAGLASPQIRNVGTLGGNLNQRPRCWYYRHPLTVCLRKGGEWCFAWAGENRYHCVIGGDGCYIVHPSDTAVALMALDASIEIAGPSGTRSIPIEQFFVGPTQDLTRETALAPGELLTRVHLPKPLPSSPLAAAGAGSSGRGAGDGLAAPARQGPGRSLYLKGTEREAGDFALVSVAAALTLDGATVRHAAVVLGGVAPVPYRARQVEAYLQGRPAAEVDPAHAGSLALPDPKPLADNGYKVLLAANLVKRAVAELLGAEG